MTVNALAEQSIDLVRNALKGGPVFGIHLYYGGGRGGAPFAVSGMSEYLEYVCNSSVGDLFTIWSIAHLESSGSLLLVDAPSGLRTDDHRLQAVKMIDSYLAEGREVLVIYEDESKALNVIWTDSEGRTRIVHVVMTIRDNASVWAVPLGDVDSEEFYLLKAKRPNELGHIPANGAY